MKYEINKSTTPWTCFPEGLDTSEFIEISTMDSPWAKYLDQKTGKTHDCGEYFEAAMNAMDDL